MRLIYLNLEIYKKNPLLIILGTFSWAAIAADRYYFGSGCHAEMCAFLNVRKIFYLVEISVNFSM